jgi:hypothetical protein
MKRWCYIHNGFFGEQEPLDNPDVTSGICDACFPGEMEKIEKIRKARALERELKNKPQGDHPTSASSDQDKPDHQE